MAKICKRCEQEMLEGKRPPPHAEPTASRGMRSILCNMHNQQIRRGLESGNNVWWDSDDWVNIVRDNDSYLSGGLSREETQEATQEETQEEARKETGRPDPTPEQIER